MCVCVSAQARRRRRRWRAARPTRTPSCRRASTTCAASSTHRTAPHRTAPHRTAPHRTRLQPYTTQITSRHVLYLDMSKFRKNVLRFSFSFYIGILCIIKSIVYTALYIPFGQKMQNYASLLFLLQIVTGTV